MIKWHTDFYAFPTLKYLNDYNNQQPTKKHYPNPKASFGKGGFMCFGVYNLPCFG
jgi:hypothetical protein